MFEVRKVSKTMPVRETAFSSKDYVKILDDISLTINEGETLGIVGESGCGKTTLAKICAGIIKPITGDVFYDGKSIFNKNFPISRKRQIIFQNTASSINPRMLIEKIIEEPLIIHHQKDKKRRKAKVVEVMEKVGLAKSESSKYISELSGGQQQRVAIAKAIILNPKLLILDEPVSSLDVSIQGKIIKLLLGLQRDLKLSYLFVAHDLNLVRQICDKVAVLYLGRIVETSDTDGLFTHPWHPYTSALISAIPLPDPRIERKREHTILKGEIPSVIKKPKGCYFNSRCPDVKDVCFRDQPTLFKIEKNRNVACHLRR